MIQNVEKVAQSCILHESVLQREFFFFDSMKFFNNAKNQREFSFRRKKISLFGTLSYTK